MPIPSDASPEFSIVENMEGDEEGVVFITVRCVFASLETRFVHVVFKTNHDDPDAVENKICMWDVDDVDTDLDAYRAAIHDLARVHIFPLLSAIPHNTILCSPGRIPIYTLSTIDGSVQLVPGILKSMMDLETHWLNDLPSIDTISADTPSSAVYDINDIVTVDLLDGGSRDVTLVILRDQPATRYVCLCIPSGPGLVSLQYAPLAKGIINEMSFLRTIPPHPHIIPPPVGYLSRVHDGKRVLCGFLLKYYPGGSLGDPERVSAPAATRIKWAHQVAGGLHHLHRVAHTYHGDIKLDNVVLDENGDAVIIDLEQGRMNEGNAAPELHAASLVSVGGDGRLCYHAAAAAAQAEKEAPSASTGADDEDEDGAIPPLGLRDRPYDIWKDTPRAIEAAEVWAFATALEPLLVGVDDASAILARCRSEDPNSRPTFGELEGFLRDLYQGQVLP